MVAVAYGRASVPGEPTVLLLTFLNDDGALAERTWSEVEQPADGLPRDVVVTRGLLQEVPPGDLRLAATLVDSDEPVACHQPFTTATGDRFILRIQLASGAGPPPICPAP